MEPTIKARFKDEFLAEAALRFAIDPGQIQLLDGFESFLYAFERDGQGYILRLGHSLRRNASLIQGEVDWINYLATGGAGVARAILSANDRLVEEIPDGQGEAFLATAFVKAPGREPQAEDWTPALYQAYGALLGRMHALAKDYPVAAPGQRYHWDDRRNLHVEQSLPPEETQAADRYYEIMDHLTYLPKTREDYGMIHQDAHGGNFFVDPANGQITLFDFDDCCYGHFIYDIAMVIFYHAQFRDHDPEFMQTFLTNFFSGYRRENRLDPSWLKEIPFFLRLREVDLYGAILSSMTPQEIMSGRWTMRYMTGRKSCIATRQPFIHFPWETLAPLLD